MSLFRIDKSRSGEKINLCKLNIENHITIVIPNYIKEISITSEGKSINASIFVEERSEDLLIKLENAVLNSGREVCIDFRCGNESIEYTNYIEFYGENSIYSSENIGVLVTCDKKLKIIGIDDGELSISSGNKGPAIGNNMYTAGAGEVYFEGKGKVYLNCDNGGNAIGFYNKDCGVVTLQFNENIYLSAIGGNGENISSAKVDVRAGDGGCGIYISGDGMVEKYSEESFDIEGGCGGYNTMVFGGGSCGHGGAAISMGSGNIKIEKCATLKGGDGGCFKGECLKAVSKGGNGGECILITDAEALEKSKTSSVTIDNKVLGIGGRGGVSQLYIDENGEFTYVTGGDGGDFINATTAYVNVILGEILYIHGKGEGCTCDSQIKCGNDGLIVKGDNVSLEYKEKPFNNEIKNFYSDIESIHSEETDIVINEKMYDVGNQRGIIKYLIEKIIILINLIKNIIK